MMEFVYVLYGVDAHTYDMLGIFSTEKLADDAKEVDDGGYAFYSIRRCEVKHE